MNSPSPDVTDGSAQVEKLLMKGLRWEAIRDQIVAKGLSESGGSAKPNGCGVPIRIIRPYPGAIESAIFVVDQNVEANIGSLRIGGELVYRRLFKN